MAVAPIDRTRPVTPSPTDTLQLAGRSFAARWGLHNQPGKGHDRVLCTDNFAAVADGATPLRADWPDAGIFAECALASLREAALHGRQAVTDVWAAAIADTAARTGAKQPQASCSVAAVWHVGRALVLSVLGDCTAIIQTTRGQSVLHDTTVPELDAQAALVPASDRAAAVLRNRASMNSPSGYWIFATDPAAADHVKHIRVDVSAVRSILLHTDGFRHMVLRERSPRELIKQWESTPALADDACFVLLEPA